MGETSAEEPTNELSEVGEKNRKECVLDPRNRTISALKNVTFFFFKESLNASALNPSSLYHHKTQFPSSIRVLKLIYVYFSLQRFATIWAEAVAVLFWKNF